MFFNLLFLLLVQSIYAVNITFEPSTITVKEDDEVTTNFTWFYNHEYEKLTFTSSSNEIVSVVEGNSFYVNETWPDNAFNGTFTVRGVFLGRAYINACVKNASTTDDCKTVPVKVLKKERAITKAFVISVGILVSLNYINMGCALDLQIVKKVLLKPVGPVLGFFCQYLLMPLVAYGVGQWLFDNPILRFGLFTFGCSPGGGASNMWTVLLRGNLNLSLTMTFISTVAALAMMPLWIFTLGRTYFVESTTKIPFENIITSLVALIVPLGIGLVIQRYLPRVAKFCKRMLATVSIVMILFIIAFGIYANLYMFKLFSWEIVVAASMNVWIGFLVSAIVSKVMRLSTEDLVAVAVETGIQNTGIAYVLLNSSLKSPDSDIASVVPVAGSIMTPIPLLIIYCYLKIGDRLCPKRVYKLDETSDDEKREIVNSKHNVSNEINVKYESH